MFSRQTTRLMKTWWLGTATCTQSSMYPTPMWSVLPCVPPVLVIILINSQGYCNSDAHVGTMLYNSYYQWVPVFFIVQAILFYIPRCIWLSTEGGMMAFLVNGCTGIQNCQEIDGVMSDLCSDRVVENPSDKQSSLLRNYCEHIHNKFNKYAACFFFCELLNVTISVSQVS